MGYTIISIVMWLLIAPFCLGLSLTRWIKKEYQSITMIMVTGYFIMLALFQVVYVPFIVFYNHFEPLVKVYAVLIAVLSAVSLIGNGAYWIQNRPIFRKIKWTTYLLWLVALALIGFQLYKTIFYQFHDGDDAYYAVISVITNTTKNMYLYLPGTGESSLLDKRHAFSAAPVFISFLASVFHLHPTIVTHVVYSAWILVFFYMVYKLIGDILLEKEHVPLFLIFVSIMNLYGNSTIFTSATFLLTRTGQGKAFLSNIIPAAGILGLLLVWKGLQQTIEKNQAEEQSDKRKADNFKELMNGKLQKKEWHGKAGTAAPWIFLSFVMITAVYTSMMGILLSALLVGGVTVLFVIIYKRLTLLMPCMISMTPLLCIGLLYLKVIFNW